MPTLRPAHPGDLPALARLLAPALPPDRPQALRALVESSCQALESDGPTPRRLLLVLDDPAAGLRGAVTLAGRTGLELPRASFRTGTVVHASSELKMFHRAPTLLLCNDLTGCAELGLPLMAADDEAPPLLRLLVDAALLYVADHADRFAPVLVCELPGIGGPHGASPFWQGLGRHFHAGALPQDSAFFPAPERSHIARLLPKHPLYSALLGPDAQACIGRHAASAQALAERLHAQGLRHHGQVNPFDAGPVLQAEVADLAAVRRSRRLKLVVDGSLPPAGARCCLLAREGDEPGGWQAHLVTAVFGEGQLVLTPEAAAEAALAPGQTVRGLALG